MSQLSKFRFDSPLKFILILGLVTIAVVVAKMVNLQGLVINALIWIESLDSGAMIAYVVIYNLATVLFIPGMFLTLGGGVLFGVVWGSVYVLIAATLGATMAFLIGRCLFREVIFRKIQSNVKFRAIALAVRKEGWKIVLLTRLCPIFPFNLLNYAYGVMRVSVRDYLLGSIIGIVPGSVMYVYIGSLAGDFARIGIGISEQSVSLETQIVQWLIRIIGFIATVAVTVYLTRVAQQALNQSISLEKRTHAITKNC